ncbi:MAG TPA: penicillin-binding protein 2 [Candidatus Hydrogenedentes bacterium]|mgnify:FL=1|nr:penicillin-binding protein 2 [Candidatus Hydrogenedentota bacterium]HPC16950.1 penicillin-binding protein 2 [Candidatus Hydrogenedentota bacterium]HRT21266.1 penicillin-binding protein 2 [Candidatus Hydrogenedentota bacterium]HRT65128.1 penicillin-binding protein 2 [Candidatus Hydrogenedentota bacterium]
MMPAPSKKGGSEFRDKRIYSLGAALTLLFAILATRLWDLQIVHWAEYRQKAEFNRLHPQRLKAPRGLIYGPDASVVLADNRPACDLVIIPAECREENLDDVCGRLERLLRIDAQSLKDKIEKSRRQRQVYRQIVVKQDISKDDLIRVEEYVYALPGVYAVARPQRRYLLGKTAGQILGYLGEINLDELAANEQYQLGDLIGRGGLEQMYEEDMHGTDGQLVVNVYASDTRPQLRTDATGQPDIDRIIDSYGRKLKEEPDFRVEPVPGRSIFTTLDVELQAYCEALLEGQVGAIAVLEADTGAVLALASVPCYDPSVFVTHGRNRQRNEALTAKPNPMVNRCFRETYAPGSTFKVMLATAALEEGVIDEHSTFYCPGFFQLPGVNRRWRCWNHSGHGAVNVVDALAFSCDVFFYNVGLKLGVDKIVEWSHKLGLGVKTGIDLPSEVEGLIPSREWKERQLKKLYPNNPWEWKWYPGNTVNLAIGQGEAAATPLQCAVMMAAIINGGHRVRPYLNKAVGPHVSEPFIGAKALEIVRAGMRKCVEKEAPAPSGTGKAAKVPGMIVLGKTGSAQMVSLEQHKEYAKEEDIPYALRDHAWFVCGVLDREPKMAICILVEHGHHGSSAAAPLAKQVIEHFYGRARGGNMNIASGGIGYDTKN